MVIRQVVIIMGLVIIVFISGLVIMQNNSETTRKDELEQAVSASVSQTVKHSMASGSTEMKSNDEMIASFLKNLFLNISSDADIEVKIMGVDYKEGLLDVNVTESYVSPAGKEKSISVRKTAIYE